MLELLQDGEKIFEKFGVNELTLPHVRLLKSELVEGVAKPAYVIQLRFDITDWPECTKPCEDTLGLNWVLRIISSDSVAVMKDTTKENRERQIKASWEQAEPGRAQKARSSREQYLPIYKRLHESAEGVTQLHLHLQSTPEPKPWLLTQQVAQKTGVEAKKSSAKAKAGAESLDFSLPVPEPTAHPNLQIKDFLERAQGDRLRVIKAPKHKTHVRTAAEMDSLRVKHDADAAAFDRYIAQREELADRSRKERDEVGYYIHNADRE